MTATLPSEFSIQEDFPAVEYDQWREMVEQALAGAPFEKKLVSKTYEGLSVQPIYSRRDEADVDDPMGFPGLDCQIRGAKALGSVKSGWDLRQEFTAPCLTATNQAILNDLGGGVTSIQLRLDNAARSGLDPDNAAAAGLVGQGGVMVYCVDDLDAVLNDVDLDRVAVSLDAGAAFIPAATSLMELWQRRGVAPEMAQGAFNSDPIAELARQGTLPTTLDVALSMLSDLASWTSQRYPNVTSVAVDSSPYHDSGASAAQDIALSIATGVEYLRTLSGGGLDIDAAANQIQFRMSLGTHHFLAIQKLRATRWLWSRVLDASGASQESSVTRIHARMGNRVLTEHDPYVNLLRNSVAVFAAGIGGADVITSSPFDAAIGLPNELSRRIARNTALVLQEESHLHRVIDPAGGSWSIDQLTKDLANKAWEIFQETERQGGIRAVLESGWVAKEVDSAYAARAKDVAKRKRGITGVSEFANVAEELVEREPPDFDSLAEQAVTKICGRRKETNDAISLESAGDRIGPAMQAVAGGATQGQIAGGLGYHAGETASVQALESRTLAAPFDRLRSICDAWKADHGDRPSIFLANIGPASHYSGRANWSTNFFEAGGFEVFGSQGFDDADAAAEAFGKSDAKIAVICSSDKLYPDVVPAAAAKLKEAGARTVVLAGHPGDNEQTWRAAGVDRFIFMRCDVLETLRSLLTEVGVIEEGEPVQ